MDIILFFIVDGAGSFNVVVRGEIKRGLTSKSFWIFVVVWVWVVEFPQDVPSYRVFYVPACTVV